MDTPTDPSPPAFVDPAIAAAPSPAPSWVETNAAEMKEKRRQRRRVLVQKEPEADVRRRQALHFMHDLDLEVQRDIYESCLEHLDDFEDGPVGFGKLKREFKSQLIWTKQQKCVFVSLIGRRSAMQLDKIASIVGKSAIECQAYLELLQAGVANERLPPLRYVDIPAAIEVPEQDIVDPVPSTVLAPGVVEDGTEGLIDLKELSRLTGLTLTDDTVELLTAYVISYVKSVLSRLPYAPVREKQIDWLLDQHHQIPFKVSTSDGDVGPRATSEERDALRLQTLQNAWRFLYDTPPPDTLVHKGEKMIIPKEEDIDEAPSMVPSQHASERQELEALHESDSDSAPSSEPGIEHDGSESIGGRKRSRSGSESRPSKKQRASPLGEDMANSEDSTDYQGEDYDGEASVSLRAFLNQSVPGHGAIVEAIKSEGGGLFVEEQENDKVYIGTEDVDPLIKEEAQWLDKYDRYVSEQELGKATSAPRAPNRMLQAFMETL